ncbi:hypothetical protein GCM10010446_69050 [Streptomyces enissocaesilis]|uniref:Uncharacterized protein n=1 Tax=Streptomyces enissocaesilis TaxID=332589 RepID=A0ABN3XPA7_9ACTN
MGRVVNGPGKVRDTAIDVSCGNGKGQVIVRGEVVANVHESASLQPLGRGTQTDRHPRRPLPAPVPSAMAGRTEER